jgi:hypothetical protein
MIQLGRVIAHTPMCPPDTRENGQVPRRTVFAESGHVSDELRRIRAVRQIQFKLSHMSPASLDCHIAARLHANSKWRVLSAPLTCLPPLSCAHSVLAGVDNYPIFIGYGDVVMLMNFKVPIWNF